MPTTFNEVMERVLSQPLDTAERPKPLPEGLYQAIILGYELGIAKSGEQNPYCQIRLRLVAPGEDVPVGEFNAAGGEEAMQKCNVNYFFTLLPQHLWRIRKFFEEILRVEIAGKGLNELLPTMVNAGLQVRIIQVPDADDSNIIYNNPPRTGTAFLPL